MWFQNGAKQNIDLLNPPHAVIHRHTLSSGQGVDFILLPGTQWEESCWQHLAGSLSRSTSSSPALLHCPGSDSIGNSSSSFHHHVHITDYEQGQRSPSPALHHQGLPFHISMETGFALRQCQIPENRLFQTQTLDQTPKCIIAVCRSFTSFRSWRVKARKVVGFITTTAEHVP